MAPDYHYQGQELTLFEEARNWKQYLAENISEYIQGTVLEAGAGLGETTAYLLNKNVSDWLCLEPDEKLVNHINQKIIDKQLPNVCRVLQGDLSALDKGDQFDTIVYIDVLEHIEQDKLELEKAAGYLKNGGHLVVLSPAFQFLYSPFDKAIGHFRRYDKASLRKIKPGTMVEKKMFYLESSGMLLLLINRFLSGKSYPSRTTVKFWDKVFIPVSRVIDKIIFHSFGKTIIGIWQKQS